MQWLEQTLPSLAANLALDEVLLLQAEAGEGGEVLRLWEWPRPAVVLGVSGKIADEVREEACRADGVPILRRASGGGTVLLGPGCLCFALVLDYERAMELGQIGSSYCYILGRIAAALADPADVQPAGTSDLACAGRKVSGNSQQRKRSFLLHHGTLLYDYDPSPVGRYLKLPRRQPDYRAGRDHAAFLANLPNGGADLRVRLRAAWQAEEAGNWPQERVEELVRDKYAQDDWTHRR